MFDGNKAPVGAELNGPSGKPRRDFLVETAATIIVSGVAADFLSACTSPSPNLAPSPNQATASKPNIAPSGEIDHETFLLMTAESLLALGQHSEGGLRFPSAIQSGNFQVDRDVGAASVGVGFLILAEMYPDDGRWLQAAEMTATWLTAVSYEEETPEHKKVRHWPDYANSRSDVSTDVYTSFDDGAIGISDFYYRLYERTGKEEYKQVSFEALEWTFSVAEEVGQGSEPAFRWRWDEGDHSQPYYIGMGEGVVGIVHTLATYYDRLKDSDPKMAARCKYYLEGGLRYLNIARQELVGQTGDDTNIRAIPYTDPNASQDQESGNTEMDSGYLSGAAGAAFMYLKLYRVFRDQSYLDSANVLFDYLEDSQNGPLVEFGEGSVTWLNAIDPDDQQNLNNNQYSNGVEEGNAGIGWVYLQAWKLTGHRRYVDMAFKAANRLVGVANRYENGGMSWNEDLHPKNKLIHANLDNGAAGIGMFLADLYDATGVEKYHKAAEGALIWLKSIAVVSNGRVYWKDNGGYDNGNSGSSSPYEDDPSWHWGDAGIIAFMVRMQNSRLDMPGPGEQSGLLSRS